MKSPISRYVILSFTLLASFVSVGCTDHVLTTPELALVHHSDVSTPPKVIIRVTDDDAAERDASYADKIATLISDAYPSVFTKAIPLTDSNTKIAISIRIRKLGAYFREINPAFSNNVVTGQVGDWNVVVQSSGLSQPVIGGYVFKYSPGNWNGVSELEIHVTDSRTDHTADFTLHLLAQRWKPNTLGYLSAHNAADDAWRVVNSELSAFFDATALKLSAERG